MSIIILAAEGSAADNFGFMNAMKQGGPVTWTTAAILTIFLFFTL